MFKDNNSLALGEIASNLDRIFNSFGARIK